MTAGTTYKLRIVLCGAASSYARAQIAFTDGSGAALSLAAGNSYSASHGSANAAEFTVLPNACITYTAQFTALAAEDGQALGISISSVRDVSTALLGVDDVMLYVVDGTQPFSVTAADKSNDNSLMIDTAGLGISTHQGTITVTAASADNTPQTIAVSLKLTAGASVFMFK